MNKRITKVRLLTLKAEQINEWAWLDPEIYPETVELLEALFAECEHSAKLEVQIKAVKECEDHIGFFPGAYVKRADINKALEQE